MSISPEYKLSDLRRTNIRSWLSTFASLGQRVRDNAPSFATLIIGSPDHPNNIVDHEVHVNSDTNDDRAQPHADLCHPSHTDAPPTSAPETPDQLSAAIEVKFLVPVLKPGGHDNGFPSDRRPVLVASADDNNDLQSIFRQAHDSVASTIRHLSLASGSGVTAPQPQSVTLHDIVAAQRQERDFWATHWIVKKSNSAEPTEAELSRGDSYIWVPVEICSPKQHWNHSDGLESLLSSITSVLRSLSAHHRVTTNYTCDVHVHIGRPDGRPLHLVTLKRLATMLWLSEDILRSIRDPSSPNYTNIYTWGAELTRHSRLARSVDTTAASDHLAQMCQTLSDAALVDARRRQTSPAGTIWRAPSRRELGRLLSGSTAQYRRLGFNFSSLGEEDERARTGPKTVEFRVLEGTLDEDVVAGWVRVCWGLVEVAGERVDDRYAGVVRACLADGIHAGRGNEGRDEEDKEEGVVKRRCGPESYIRVEGFRAMAVDGLGIRDREHDAFIRALVKERHARR
ncbi:hypothetical protein GE09DRAFT_72719 [Coniochaeta sp. 2T2.1]|nr:hypothetical protein GE09DRAFT_72719 [Coniochaeta sp. 2T2.1]